MGTGDIGLKEAQYYLDFMYLKGQHVQQSVGLGMAWLGVACETKIPERQQKSPGSAAEKLRFIV